MPGRSSLDPELVAAARDAVRRGQATIRAFADRKRVSYGALRQAVVGATFKDMADPPPLPGRYKPPVFAAADIRRIRQGVARAEDPDATEQSLAGEFGVFPATIRDIAQRLVHAEVPEDDTCAPGGAPDDESRRSAR